MAAQYFRALPPYVEERSHAFVGVGWTADEIQSRVPFIVCLSNSIGHDGEWLARPGTDFHMHRETLRPPDPISLFVAPPLPSDEAVGHLAARIGSRLRESDDPAPVARMLIQAIRDEAETNSDVGKGIMVNCLPRAPGPPTGDVMLIEGCRSTMCVRSPTSLTASGKVNISARCSSVQTARRWADSWLPAPT
jgi:hypothetical protein